jgi:hypothetical protein
MRVVGIYWTMGDSASSRGKLDWLAPQVVPVQLDQIEGVEKLVGVVVAWLPVGAGAVRVASRGSK